MTVKALKQAFGQDLVVMTDVCLCAYTDTGHCGVNHGAEIVNDPSVAALARMAVAHAEAGADIVAPSDMMDGRIRAMREALEAAGLPNTGILSYAIKHAGAYYGPFREAADSSPKFGDRRSYQMDPRNAREGAAGRACWTWKRAPTRSWSSRPCPTSTSSGGCGNRPCAPSPPTTPPRNTVRSRPPPGWAGWTKPTCSGSTSSPSAAPARTGSSPTRLAKPFKSTGSDMENANDTLFQEALTHFPGGVSSPVRAFRAVGGTPKFFRKAWGARFEDEEGRRYVDLCMSWGPLILGHAVPEVLAAAREAMEEGLTFGAPSRREIILARRIKTMVPFVEKMRFVSSGTEAVMSALRAARGFTGRDRVIKFEGCYHGHCDGMLVKAGSGLVTFGEPSSAGVPKAFADLTTVIPLDDLEALEPVFAKQGGELAAVIIEPIPANNGLLVQDLAFLQRLRELCTGNGTVLIFDEVISGFRVAPGGAAELFGITPDLVTYGKIIGGGMPVGLYGGRKDIMAVISPDGPVYQAGTLSGNPVAMAAGLATLEKPPPTCTATWSTRAPAGPPPSRRSPGCTRPGWAA